MTFKYSLDTPELNPEAQNITITDCTYSNKEYSNDIFIDENHLFSEGTQHSQAFFISPPAPTMNSSRDLTFRGIIPPDLLNPLDSISMEVTVHNDAALFQNNVIINMDFQRSLVEWVTERWHSKFEISKHTWDLFRTKAAAIFNESLLTAKLSELGYTPESYGDKKYYD
jgi:hypothetical protein